MAACGSLEHIFENPLENSTLLESLSPWKQIKSKSNNPIDNSSFIEIFGELHFKESSSSPPLSSSNSDGPGLSPRPVIDTGPNHDNNNKPYTSNYSQKKQYRNSDSFSSMNSESLSLCTEGLGFESFDDVDDLVKNENDTWHHQEEKRVSYRRNVTDNHEQMKRSRTSGCDFPPPISCIGRNGKPWVCFKSFRENGRFILKEIRIPTQEFLHACRENGRLRLNFVQSDDEIPEEDEEENDDDGENGEEIR